MLETVIAGTTTLASGVAAVVSAGWFPAAAKISKQLASGPNSLSTSENHRLCLSYTGRVTPSEYTQASSSTGAPTYTMNESCGAFAPAAELEMKLPATTANGSPWNHPARVLAFVRRPHHGAACIP